MHSDREDKNDSHIFNFSVYTTFLSLPVLPWHPTIAPNCLKEVFSREHRWKASQPFVRTVLLTLRHCTTDADVLRCSDSLLSLWRATARLTAACNKEAHGMPLDSPPGSSCWDEPPGHCHREIYGLAPHPPEEGGGDKGGIKKKGINSRNKMEVKMVDMFSDSALIGSLARGTGGDGGYHCLLTQCNFSLGNNKRAL